MFAPPVPFTPHPWFKGSHRQTLAGAVLPCRASRPSLRPGARLFPIPLRPERSRSGRSATGGRLEAWFAPGERDVAVALLHGLGGSIDSPYLRACFDALADAGFATLAVNQRGSGGSAEQTDRPYMTGHVDDAADVVRALRAAGCARVLLVGFSISGNTVLKLVGEPRADLPDGAIAVAPPVDLDRASRSIARAYDLWILRSCRRWIPRLRGQDAAIGRVPALSDLRTFDRNYIGPVWGFASLADYYASASAAPRLPAVSVPTLVLQASNDPVVRPDAMLEARRSPFVRVDLTPCGGHLGWIESKERRAQRWLARALVVHASAFAAHSVSRGRVSAAREEDSPCAAH